MQRYRTQGGGSGEEQQKVRPQKLTVDPPRELPNPQQPHFHCQLEGKK
jgi:hypothetical protein